MNNEVIEIKINEHSEMLKEHDKRIDKIEQDAVEFKTEIKNLCDSIKGLTTTMKWFMGLFLSGGVGLIFYLIQQHLSK